jgi:hypothetical protein
MIDKLLISLDQHEAIVRSHIVDDLQRDCPGAGTDLQNAARFLSMARMRGCSAFDSR